MRSTDEPELYVSTERYSFDVDGLDVLPWLKELGFGAGEAKRIENWIRRWRWLPRFPRRRRTLHLNRGSETERIQIRVDGEDFDTFGIGVTASPAVIEDMRNALHRVVGES